VTIPFSAGGWSATITAGVRSTFYSNSIDPLTRLILGRDVTRTYGEFELDVRPPAIARNYRRGDKFLFRHVIEPYVIYRKIGGINNFARIIRFGYTDAIADTSEIEYGLTNRIFTRRSTENVSGRTRSPNNAQKAPLTTQPYEVFSLTVRGKYFFDRYFGGALVSRAHSKARNGVHRSFSATRGTASLAARPSSSISRTGRAKTTRSSVPSGRSATLGIAAT